MSEYKFLSEQTVYPVSSKGYDPHTGMERFTQNPEVRSLEKVETNILQSTDGLIGALDGTLDANSKHYLDGERRYDKVADAAIYLDKSGRPVRMLVHELWKDLSDGIEPSTSFLNIDKEDYMLEMGISDKEYKTKYIPPAQLTLDRLSEKFVGLRTAEIRALYFEHAVDIEEAEQLIEAVREGKEELAALKKLWEIPTQFDGKHVALVDEVRSSGATLHIADQLLQKAFPEATFEPLYWSTPAVHHYTSLDTETGEVTDRLADTEKPLWYDASTSAGRGGIEGKSEILSTQSENVRIRVGRFVLSTPYRWMNDEPDVKGAHLREDIKALAAKLRQKKIGEFIPSLDRDNVEEQFNKFNTESFADWSKRRRDKKKVSR